MAQALKTPTTVKTPMTQVVKTPMTQVVKTPMTHVTKTTLRPLHDRILVKRLAEGDEKHGSIIIPDSAKEKPQEGKVIAVGTGKVTEAGRKIPLDVKAGDRILFGKYSGSEVKLDGQEYLTMREEDVLGILSA
jgi:chaperonin GroES